MEKHSLFKKRYGKYAKELAQKSLKTKKRYHNYIEKHKDYAVIKTFSKIHGYDNIFIDIEDINILDKYTWSIDYSVRNNNIRKVARNSTVGLLHRYLLNIKDPNIMIDHINRNPLDNRKKNLRLANNSINQRNKKMQSNNTSGIVGVRFNKNLNIYTARIATDQKRKSKSFSVNKYGKDKALELAIQWRKNMEKENGYL